MSWQPQSAHVSQIHADGSGWDDCYEACMLRYLRESGKANPAGDIPTQLAALAQYVRGIPDAPDNPGTSVSQAETALAGYQIAYQWTDSFQQAIGAYWAILLVNGIALAPAQYPASWFGGENWPDHFILSLPAWQGSYNWFNDPLAYANGQQDCQYDLASVAAAFGGALILPATGHGEESPAAAPVVPPRVDPPAGRGHVTRSCALKSQPNHTSVGIARLAAGNEVLITATQRVSRGEIWRYCQWAGRWGWLPESYLAVS